MRNVFKKDLLLTSFPVDGFYRHKDYFQIVPMDGWEKRYGVDTPLVIEFPIEKVTREQLRKHSDFPEFAIQKYISSEKCRQIYLLLTVFTSTVFFQYSMRQSWFIPSGADCCKDRPNIWGTKGYNPEWPNTDIDDFSEPTANELRRVDASRYYKRSSYDTDHVLDLPDCIDNLFEKFISLTQKKKSIYLSSASLFHQGIMLWGDHPSLSFAAMVSALESIISFDVKPKPGEIKSSFKAFLKRYANPSDDFDEFSTKIYNKRCKILHGGHLFLGEVKSGEIGSFDIVEDDDFRRSVIRICRIALVNWLLSQ